MDGQNYANFVYTLSLTRSSYRLVLKTVIFRKFATEYQPLIDVRNWFLINILRMDGQNFTNFVYTLSLTRSMLFFVKRHFSKNLQELQPLIDVRNWLLLNILKMDWQNLIKFCIHFIIDKIYVGIVKGHFFANLQQSCGPWLMSEIGFCSIS